MLPSLKIQRLTAAAFAPFGQVIDVNQAQQRLLINKGSTERFHNLAQVQMSMDDQAEAHTGLSIFRAKARVLPFAITLLERHPLGSQAFMPLSHHPYLVVVAPQLDLSTPDCAHLQVFWCESYQGVNYAQGTWHHPLISWTDASDFLVVDRVGNSPNCDEFFLPSQHIRMINSADLKPFYEQGDNEC